MAETPSGYFPDFKIQYDPKAATEHVTEILRARSLREQRRGVATLSGLRRFGATSKDLSMSERKTLYVFLQSKRGRLGAFYWFHDVPEDVEALAVGSVSGAASLIAPFKGPWWTGDTPVAASITDVKVGGVTKAFTMDPNIGSGGEDRINFTGGAQTGAVTVTGTLVRHRLVARYDADMVDEAFLRNAASLRVVIPIVIQELL